jgi:hypothetical protein
LHLMDGSMITGRLSLKELTVETKFGTLNVPVANIRSFTPGLSSHPTLSKQIAGWIEELGSGTFNDREEAQKSLMKLGPSVRAELERRRDDSDAERRTRVRAILGEFEQAQISEAFRQVVVVGSGGRNEISFEPAAWRRLR